MSLLNLFSKTKTQHSENIDTIKDFFFYHHGDGMSMDRDDPQKYKQYRSLKEDGGIYLIQSKADLNELLKTAINTLSDFTCTVSDNISEVGWENIQQRYENANKAIQSAFKKIEID